MDDVLQRFLGDIDDLGPAPAREPLAAAVHTLAMDLDYWRHHIERSGVSTFALHRPDQGVQVFVVRRIDGTMSYIHSHSVWVALSAIEGVETHRRFAVQRIDDHRATVALAEEQLLRGGHGDVVTLVPPNDVHSHGHVRGSGDWPFTLIVLGDNFLRYQRDEFDFVASRRRILPPGETGTANLEEPAG